MRHLPWEQEQAGALPAVLTISRDAGAGDGQDFTGLAAVVRLHPRVAFGLQALQRCSGHLSRRARGSTVATHHFADVAQQRQQQFRKLPGALPHESANLSIGSISASVVKLLSSSASNGEFAGGSPAGCTKSCRVSPTTRDAPLRTERLGVELPHAAPFRPLSPTQRRRP